jgi:hypothetical protein
MNNRPTLVQMVNTFLFSDVGYGNILAIELDKEDLNVLADVYASDNVTSLKIV